MVPNDTRVVPFQDSVNASEEPRALCIVRDMTTSDCQRTKFTLNLPASITGQKLLNEVVNQCNYQFGTFELVLQRMTDGESIVVNDHLELQLLQLGFHCGDGRRNNLIIGDKNGEQPKKIKDVGGPPVSTESEDKGWGPVSFPKPAGVYGERRGGIGKWSGNSYDAPIINDTETKHATSNESSFAPGYVGLVNQAMTCYLNSLLQTLFMTPEFRNAMYRWEFDKAEDPSKSIPYQLQRIFLHLQTSNRHAVETTELTRSFGWDSSEAWQQHDVQELCRVMFDALEQKFRNTDQADLINRLYQGKVKDYVKCLECGFESAREDTYLDIPLPVRPFGASVAFSSVEEALQAFVQPELLEGTNQYFCDKCNRKCDAHKGLKFTTFPYLLTLQLKRFDFDYSTMHRIKLNDRVTFQEILNLNSFVKCENEETTDNESTTDSGSALEEDNASARSGSGCGENHDDDEGIDMESHHSHEATANEKNLSHSMEKGPYLYELFSIMVHSGSANGGHYYAYIKSFKDGQWYCFNDQSVSKVTYDDIKKTYGGGPTSSYYSGAYSSSTNAYMLMYRQIDGEQNVEAMSVEEFPEHIRDLLQATQQKEEVERQQRELERNMCKIKLYWNDPIRKCLTDAVLKVHKDTTLEEATFTAHQISGFSRTAPLKCCRLVKYDDAHDSLECSFDADSDSQPIGELLGGAKSSYRFSLLLEVWPPNTTPPVYRPGGTTVKAYAVDLKAEEVTGPVTIRSYLTQTVADFKAQVAQAFGFSCNNPRVVLERYYNDLRPLNVLTKTLKAEGFYRSNKVFVEIPSGENVDEDATEAAFQRMLDRYEHTISLQVTLPTVDNETVSRLLRMAQMSIVDMPNGEIDQELNEVELASSIQQEQQNCEKIKRSSDRIARTKYDNVEVQLPPDYDDEGIGDSECDINHVQTSTYAIHNQQTSSSAVVQSDHSEDSSLTDSDRTIIGNSPPHNDTSYQRLDNILRGRSNSSGGSCSSSESNLSRPGSSCENDRNLSSPEVFVHSEASCNNWDESKDDETSELPKEEEKRYFRATLITSPTTHEKSLRINVDKRITLGALKNELEPYVGVPVNCFKIYRLFSNNQEYECTKLNENFVPFGDDTQIIIKVGRALRKGEYRVKVYQFVLNDPEPSKFLLDWVFAKGMTILQAKQEILPEIKTKCGLDVPLNRCRLRKKNWQTPAAIYIDSQRFEDHINIFDNLEVYLEILTEPEKFTCSSQLALYVRWWHPAEFALDVMREIVLDNYTLEQLKDKIHEISNIPLDCIDYAKGIGSFPYDMSLLAVHTDLYWNPQITLLTMWPMYICDDGLVVFFKDSRETLKQLNDDERRELVTKENTKMQKQTRGVYSPRKERALKIYTDTRPPPSTEPD